MKRTLINEILDKVGEKVLLKGWVDTKRDHGKITFVDLRDRTGIVQCVGVGILGDLGTEYVAQILGEVKKRPDNMVNPDGVLGTIEIEVSEYKVLNESSELPIPIDSDGRDINEEARLKYRYLDIRRKRMSKNLRLRADLTKNLRQALYAREFIEIETPILTKATKEGARDFIVPSRHHPGKFYALPQSPQQYKQLLMCSGVEKYFQFARCIRDEDLRADRGYEHTQLDLEMSFVDLDDVMRIVEELVIEGIEKSGGLLKSKPFPVINYEDAIKDYGDDKFDLRTEKEKEDNYLAFAWVINFPFFKKVDTKDKAEVADGKSGWTFTHNPFSMPKEEHLEWHLNGENLDKIVTLQYDLVCNGYEVGGGSIRAHKPEVLRATFKAMGYSESEINDSIGHMLKAFELGAPPHGGIALGIDRLAMVLSNEKSLKEVIAFPMTSSGKTSVMDAPSDVTEKLLEELSLDVELD
ncbi:amino acid--tRNA ligase-related protein [Patescibacteria group bacterium]